MFLSSGGDASYCYMDDSCTWLMVEALVGVGQKESEKSGSRGRSSMRLFDDIWQGILLTFTGIKLESA